MKSIILWTVILIISPLICSGEIVDPTTVECPKDEFLWCEYDNGLIRGGGAAPRKCANQCICEGHPSFYGDNLDWIDGKCVTPKGYACGPTKEGNKDGTLTIHCATGSECIQGRCRDPNAPKLKLTETCQEDVECESGLECKQFLIKSPPLPPLRTTRRKRAIGPQYCCHHPKTDSDTSYTLEEFPCNPAKKTQ